MSRRGTVGVSPIHYHCALQYHDSAIIPSSEQWLVDPARELSEHCQGVVHTLSYIPSRRQVVVKASCHLQSVVKSSSCHLQSVVMSSPKRRQVVVMSSPKRRHVISKASSCHLQSLPEVLPVHHPVLSPSRSYSSTTSGP